MQRGQVRYRIDCVQQPFVHKCWLREKIASVDHPVADGINPMMPKHRLRAEPGKDQPRRVTMVGYVPSALKSLAGTRFKVSNSKIADSINRALGDLTILAGRELIFRFDESEF